MLFFVFFHTSATSLPLCLEIWVPHFAILSFFSPPALPLLLSGGHSYPRHLFHSAAHTVMERGSKGDR